MQHMAAITQIADNDNSAQATTRTLKERSRNEVFTAKDSLDQPCDIVLVVEDGKQLNAQRNVLLEASPFFEKLLNSDMKESNEGIVRLEMFSESVISATLEFIYTGHVQILTEDNARGLIIVADYLFLPKLKILAEGILAQKLIISNCISIYYFSESYQCEELLSKTKKFVLANFTAVYTANREEILNMSIKEVERWISSDDIDVNTEEDVFEIIVAWINHDKSKRKKYFVELFRQVRLFYVSRDFLCSDVVTNDLVKKNEGCLELVKNCRNFSVPPRKSLEAPAIVVHNGVDLMCYFPDENNWCRLGQIPSTFELHKHGKFFPCEGKLYSSSILNSVEMVSYNPYTNSCMRLPPLERSLWKIFVKNESEMWALWCDPALLPSDTIPLSIPLYETEGKEHVSLFISKYKPLSHSWEDVALFDHFHPDGRKWFCVVASDHFVYLIGGVKFVRGRNLVYLSNVDRFDLSKGQWDKVADIQVARSRAHGVAANGKIFLAGGESQINQPFSDPQCEMYDETTNEWQSIARFKKLGTMINSLVAADGKLYVVNDSHQISVECYNPEKNEWEMKTERAFPKSGFRFKTCSMRIFKGLSNIRSQETNSPESLSTQALSSHQKARNQKCLIT